MMTQKQINNLKGGDKLIFFRDGGVLQARPNYVFTFANWMDIVEDKCYWQCKELHNIGNHEHNFSIYDTELFDEKKHKKFVIMDEKTLLSQRQNFIEKFGDAESIPHV